MDLKQLPEDFQEFISSLNSNRVRYLLVGGWAVAIYGYPRATKDIDFLVAIDDKNLERLRNSLLAFGVPITDMAPFKKVGYVFRAEHRTLPTLRNWISPACILNFYPNCLNLVRHLSSKGFGVAGSGVRPVERIYIDYRIGLVF